MKKTIHQMFNTISLRMQITIITTTILVIVVFVLTGVSMYNANYSLVQPISTAIIMESIYPYANDYYPQYMEGLIGSTQTNAIDVSLYAEEAITVGKSNFQSFAIEVMILIILVGAGIIYYMLGKFLSPVKKLSDEIESINEKKLSQRLVGFDSSGELQELSHSFNMMLDRLDRAFETQKRFSSDAAHELKTPLTVLKTKLDVLQMEEDITKDDYDNFVEVTKKQTERMIHLLEHLFILSAGADYELKDEVFIDSLFVEILEDLQGRIEEKSLTVRYEPCEATLVGNQLMLTHAFSNLIQNAIKYNYDSGEITIKTMFEYNRLLIQVIDTGIGIPEEKSESIFEAFYCVDPSRSRKFGGAGLGLAITKDVVERHAGTIEYLPNPRGGSIFKVILPIEKSL